MSLMKLRFGPTFWLATVAVLGLLSGFAVSAQAENLSDGGKTGLFLIKGSSFSSSLDAKFSFEQEGTGVLTQPARNLALLCQKSKGEGLFNSDTDVKVTVSFTECSTWVNVELVIEKGLKHKTEIPCTVGGTNRRASISRTQEARR